MGPDAASSRWPLCEEFCLLLSLFGECAMISPRVLRAIENARVLSLGKRLHYEICGVPGQYVGTACSTWTPTHPNTGCVTKWTPTRSYKRHSQDSFAMQSSQMQRMDRQSVSFTVVAAQVLDGVTCEGLQSIKSTL